MTGASAKNPFLDPSPDQLLRAAVGLAFRRGRLQHVYNILRGKDLETGEVSAVRRVEQFERLRHAQDYVLDLTNWHEFLKCLVHGGYRSRRMVTSENALIYTYVLWLVGRRDFGLDLVTLRGVIARWFFMAHTTGRYTSSPESQVESDLGRISALAPGDGSSFCDELDRIVAANFTGDYWDISLPNRLDTSSPRSPALYAYWAALNLLDAELLFSSLRIRELLDPVSALPARLSGTTFSTRFSRGSWDCRNPANQRHREYGVLGLARESEHRGAGPGSVLASHDSFDSLRQAKAANLLACHSGRLGATGLCRVPRAASPTDCTRRAGRLSGTSYRSPGPPRCRDRHQICWLAVSPKTLEFKSSARWNVKAGMPDRKMEQVVVKTVCGFLNAQGGTLLIGVDDERRVVGLSDDFKTLGSKPDTDGFELFLRQRLDSDLSVSTAGVIKIRFEEGR